MISRQKKLTKYFFNKVSREWFTRTYDPKGNLFKYPGNSVRMATALGEIVNLGIKNKNTLDIGCGTGQLVIELLKQGQKAEGIDIASNMIDEARMHLGKASIKADPEKVFKVSDLANFKSQIKYDAVTALGLLEYLDTDAELFSLLKNAVKPGGYAFVECRNKFFNLFSANDYIVKAASNREIGKLISEMKEVERFSPTPDSEIPKIQKGIAGEMESFLGSTLKNKNWMETIVPTYTKYPKYMVRRQHTPQELELSAKKFGFELKYVVYWHAHLYLPKYESKFPKIYNKLSLLMTPLGRTSLGAWMCSSFICVLKKK